VFPVPTADLTSIAVIVQVDSEQTAQMIASQVPIFEALIKGCKEVKIVTKDSEVPAGCGTEQISVQAIVHVPVKVRMLDGTSFISTSLTPSYTSRVGQDRCRSGDRSSGKEGYVGKHER
jgi:hypothetical protein